MQQEQRLRNDLDSGGTIVAQTLRLLNCARRDLGPDVSVLRMLILLSAYENEGVSQGELLGYLERTSAAALSRNLADLSALSSSKTSGLGLIELRIDPKNLRKRHVFLTAKGKRLIKRWLKQAGAAGDSLTGTAAAQQPR